MRALDFAETFGFDATVIRIPEAACALYFCGNGATGVGQIFSEKERAQLERIGVAVGLQPGEMLYFQGDPADRVFYIKKGRLRVFQVTPSGREVTVDVVEAGHLIGESGLVPESLRPACIQAVNAVQLISVRTEELLRHLAAEPELALHFLQQCSETMDRLAARLYEQCLLDRYGKVASFMLDLTATDSPEKGTVGGILPYTHENIADSLGLNRTTVTGVLSRFENSGWIESGYRWVRVKDRAALEAFVQEQIAR